MKRLVVLIAIIFTAFFLRTYQLKQFPPGLYPDEAMNGNNALETLATGNWKAFYPENNGREGLFINIQALFVKALGNEPWVLRLPSTFFGTLTVIGIYFAAQELFRRRAHGGRIALFASFFAATSFWHIIFSRIGFRAVTAPFYLVWGIYFLLAALRKERYMPYAMLGGLFYGLGFHSYIAYRGTPLLILILLIVTWKERGVSMERIKKTTITFTTTTCIAIVPLALYFIQHPQDFLGRTAQVSVFSSPTLLKDLTWNIAKTIGMFNIYGDGNWRHNLAGRPELFWPVGIVFLVGIFLSIRHIVKEKKWGSPETIVFSWLAITALPVVISNEGIPHALRAIIMIPAVFILAGIGASYMTGILVHFTSSRYAATSIFLIASLLTFEAYYTYFIAWGPSPETAGAFAQNYADLGRQLNSLPPSLPKYIVVEASGGVVRGLPMPAQTTMFITDTFTPEKQRLKNIHYVLPENKNSIPPNSFIAYIR